MPSKPDASNIVWDESNIEWDGGSPTSGRDTILKKDIGQMSAPNKFWVGVGAGLYDLAKGIEQKGAQLGEKVGVVSPETVARITQEGQEARDIMKPLYEESTAAKVGKVVGETAPTFAIPGGVAGGALRRAGTAALSGAAIGAARFTGEGEDTGTNALTGAAFGGGTSAVLSGAGKVVNAIGGKALKSVGEKYNIPTTLGEDLGNATTQRYETLLEKVPITGIRKFRETQLKAADDAAKEFLGKYVIGDVGSASIEANRAFSSAQFEKMKGIVKDVADMPVIADKTNSKAKEILSRYPDLFKKFQDTKREGMLSDIVKGTEVSTSQDVMLGTVQQPKTSFSNIWELRDSIGSMIGQAKKKLASGELDRTQVSELNSLYSAVNKDIDNWASSVGKPELRDAINTANDAYKRYVVKYSLLQKAYDDAAGKSSAKEMFSPKTFSTSLKKIVAKDKEYKSFTPAEIEEMTGLANIMQVVKRAGQYAENPPTGNRMIDAALGGGAMVGGYTALAATAKTAGVSAATTYIAKLLTTTKAGKSLITAASKIEPESPAMSKLMQKVYNVAPRMLESGSRAGFSSSDIPDMVSTAEAVPLQDYMNQRKAYQDIEGEIQGSEAPTPSTTKQTTRQTPNVTATPEEIQRLKADLEKRKAFERNLNQPRQAIPQETPKIPRQRRLVQIITNRGIVYRDADTGEEFRDNPNEL